MRKLSLILPLAMLAFGNVVVNSEETSSHNAYTKSVTREVSASGYPTKDQK
ncbi:hypothetical protein [Nostoc sp. NMS8]|uniref:hypothetical protein n=1 Tax=Nostoc sp. NMS8 TaxID=2815392 RepID=UPI0025DC9774|nr:hypothetical protein [Nostoc sp. NMS8]